MTLNQELDEHLLATRLSQRVFHELYKIKYRAYFVQPDLNLTWETSINGLNIKTTIEPYVEDLKQLTVTIFNDSNKVIFDAGLNGETISYYSTSVQEAPDWIKKPDELLHQYFSIFPG